LRDRGDGTEQAFSPQQDGRIAPGTVKVPDPVAALGAHFGEDVMFPVVVETATAIPDADCLDIFLTTWALNSRDKEREKSHGDPAAQDEPEQERQKRDDERCRRVGRTACGRSQGHGEKKSKQGQPIDLSEGGSCDSFHGTTFCC
jgi:hypothetical protein